MTNPSEPADGRPDPGPSTTTSERWQLTGLAYRLLGSLAEAEDAVRETYARWHAMSRARREAIESPAAWLTAVASRICLDLLGPARARRERYPGEWLPEPLPGRPEWRGGGPPDAGDPADPVTLDESLHMAFLVALEATSPAERVAFILHDVFRHPFAEVAAIVGRSPTACRQLAATARRRVPAARPPTTPAAPSADLVRRFQQAWQARDSDALIGLLAPDATATADGGGLVRAEPRPVRGAGRIARHLVERPVAASGTTILERPVNGRPGLVAQVHGTTVSVLAFDIPDDRIERIWTVLNPDKLRPWATG